MSYTITSDEGTVVRDADGKVIAPCQSADDPDFIEYQAWIEAGGEPRVIESEAGKAARERVHAKSARQAAVDAIKVTTSTGRTFDGDEVSQTRMTRAVLAMQAVGATEIRWVLADNTPVMVEMQELVEALVLAGEEQTRLWVLT